MKFSVVDPAGLAPDRPRKHASSRDGFFVHHGIWAPGVRLFRQAQFTTKALLVSLAFLIPIALLMGAYLKTVQDSIDFAVGERAGIRLLKAAEPWQIEAQKQRRLVMSGASAGVDLPAIDNALAEVRKEVAAKPAGLDLQPALAEALQRHDALRTAVQAGNAPLAAAQALQAYVDGIR